MDRVDCVVIGAGVVGLACAEALAERGLEVVVLEAAEAIGTETSSRNSEVIHAGIYYPTGSLKARFCVDGKHRLYARAEAAGIPVNNCGKLIVATDEGRIGELERLKAQAAQNGVPDLELWSAQRARALEPNLACAAALWSPSTGIVDSHALMLSLQGGLEDHGGTVALHAPVLGGEVLADGIALEVGGAEPMRLAARRVVNSAGLNAPRLGAAIRGVPPETVPRAHYAKGSYYTLIGRSPFSRLIYPAPGAGAWLGVHVTLDLAGQTRFGPDMEWLDGPDFSYAVDPARAAGFYAAVRTYWPDLKDGTLVPAYSGVRPKITGPGEPAADYVVQDETVHGVKGLIQLYGIESPGLTSALAIGAHVADRLA